MPLYTKAASALVYDLINAENPSLPKVVTSTNVALGTPTALTNSSWPAANTSIVLSAKNSDYIGKQTVNYRRLDLSKMFRGMTVEVAKYVDVTSATASTVVWTVLTLLSDLNALYGLQLTADDLTDANIVRGSTLENSQYTTTVTVTVKSTSLGYTGSFSLKWINALQNLSSMVLTTDIGGRAFPGGNDFTDAHVVINSVAWGYDFSSLAAANPWISYPTGYTVSQNSSTVTFINAAMAAINAQYGTTLPTNGTAAEWALAGIVLTAANAAYPEVDFVDYNHCFVITAPARYGVSQFYFHFNI
jgi:hypothetical protein